MTFMTFEQIAEDYFDWAKVTFDTTASKSINHLIREAKEVKEELDILIVPDVTLAIEFADLTFMVLYAINKSGLDIDTVKNAMIVKLEINKKREWLKNEDGTYSHIK